MILAKLNHKNIVIIYDFIESDDSNYIVEEYMPPELFDEKPKISQLGDIYSLGCIFSEMERLNFD